MKVGDLVKPKTNSNEAMIGIVLKIEEKVYNHNQIVTLYEPYTYENQDRLTVYWAHGETTTEPSSYVEKVAENEE